MTEKRFEVYDDGFSKHIEDTYYTEDRHEHNLYDIWEMCHKLNKLYEENRELQRHLDIMRSGALTDDKRIKELYYENEQFKKALRAAYSTKLTETTKHTLEIIAKKCGVDLE